MIAKFVTFAAIVAAAYGQAAQYPAGVNPNLCPNYPHCDNALLAAYNPAPGVAPAAPQYYSPAPYAAPQYAPQQIAPAAGYPAGVSPASCPNYPYCNVGGAAPVAAPPLPGFTSRLYPDGVNPAACPNYPYCS